jgi:predicted Zn-dependent protease
MKTRHKAQYLLPTLGLFLTLGSCFSSSPDEKTALLYARAASAYAGGRFSESAALLKGLMNFPPALTLRGKAEYFSGEAEAAEKSLRRSLALRPSGAEAALYLARLLREKGELREAGIIIEGLLEDDPRNIRALRFAADLAREKGASGEEAAAVFLDRAVEAAAESALVFIDRARLRWIRGNDEGALEDLRRAKDLLPWATPMIRSIENLEKTIAAKSEIKTEVLP